MRVRIIDTGYHRLPNPQNYDVHQWVTRVDGNYDIIDDHFAQWSFNLVPGGTALHAAELLRIEIDGGRFRIVHNEYWHDWQRWPRDNRWHTYPLWIYDTRFSYSGETHMYMAGRLRLRIVEPLYNDWITDTMILLTKALDEQSWEHVKQARRELALARLARL